MSNHDSKVPADKHPRVAPPQAVPVKKAAEMEVDQKVRHASGQKLGAKETLTDIERDKLAGKTRDPSNP